MKTEERPNETGLALGLSLIAVQIFLLTATLLNGFQLGSFTKGPQAILTGIYIQVWGLLFLASYYFEHKSFLFRGLMWVCENFSSPKGRFMAFFYFALAFGLGTMALVIGLGII